MESELLPSATRSEVAPLGLLWTGWSEALCVSSPGPLAWGVACGAASGAAEEGCICSAIGGSAAGVKGSKGASGPDPCAPSMGSSWAEEWGDRTPSGAATIGCFAGRGSALVPVVRLHCLQAVDPGHQPSDLDVKVSLRRCLQR